METNRGRLFSRREMLWAAAVPLLMSAPSMAASKRYLIDVHHHCRPPVWIKAWNRHDAPWSAEQSIALMDQWQVAAALMSVTMPFIWLPNKDIAGSRTLARQCNDYMAEQVSRFPHRFGFYGALPLPDTEGSLAEIAYVLDTLKADGISLVSQFDGRFLGDPAFVPVFEELNRRQAVIYVHPYPSSPCCGGDPTAGQGVLGAEIPFDTTRTILSLLASGAISRYTGCKFIFSHGGGAIPFVASRLTRALRLSDAGKQAVPEGPDAALRTLYFDTATAANPPAFSALLAFTSPSHILFGSDSPYGEMDENAASFQAMEQKFNVSAADRLLMEHGSAEKLFPRLAKRLQA